MQLRRTTSTTTITGAALATVLAMGLSAPAAADNHEDSPDDLGRSVLGETDGWAAHDGGTTGGSAAEAEHVFHVDTWQEFREALGGEDARGSTTPRIVYVEGELNAYEQEDGTLATCETFEEETGFDQDDYIAAFDPETWEYTVSEEELTALQDLQNEAAAAQASQTQQHIGSNTTVVGVGEDARIVGANLRIRDADNVIVRNLTVSDSTDCFPEWDPSDTGAGNWNSRYDNISVWASTHVWVDHNRLDSGDLPPSELAEVYGRPYEVHDGLLDITHGSDLVTASYNVFGEHDKTMLIGSSDSRTEDRGLLRVTLHHNHWVDIGQRAPRVRYGQVHVYNNLYTQTRSEGFSYYWGVGIESQLVVENNYIELADGADPANIIALWTDLQLDEGMTERGTMINGEAASALVAYNAAAAPEDQILDPANWDPELHGTIDATETVPDAVRQQAGPILDQPEPTDPPAQQYGFFLNDGWDTRADHVFHYGRLSDQVLIGDWDGNGTDTITVRRGNIFYVSNAPRGGPAELVFAYGRPGDVILVGDWDGDGVDTLAVRRGAEYLVRNSLTSGPADDVAVYGRADDTVLVGDWDADSRDTFAVRRGAQYFVNNSISAGAADDVVVYGRADDVTLAGDWDADGADTLAVRRGPVYFLKNSISPGQADLELVYGRAGDEVYVGDWNGDGTDTLGVRRTP